MVTVLGCVNTIFQAVRDLLAAVAARLQSSFIAATDFEMCSFIKHLGFFLTASFVSWLLPVGFCGGLIPQPGAQLLGTGVVFVP